VLQSVDQDDDREARFTSSLDSKLALREPRKD